MVRLNLLPPSHREKLKNRRLSRLLVLFAFLLLIVFAGAGAALFVVGSGLKSALLGLDQKIKAQQNVNATYGDTEAEAKALEGRLSTIKTLDTKRLKWSAFLQEFQATTPPFLRITQFQNKDNKLTINGTAKTRTEIVKFVEKLETSNLFSKVEFESATKDDPENPIVSFTIQAQLEKR